MACLGEYIQEESHPLGETGGNGLNMIGVSNERGLEVSTRKTSAKIDRYVEVRRNWFAYNPMRINVGSIGLADNENKTGFTSPDYTVFSCKDGLVPEYLLRFLKSEYGLEAIVRHSSGAVRKRLYFSGLSEIELEIPSVEKQLNAISRFQAVEQAVEFICKENSNIVELPLLKQAILQEAIQGKLTEEWRAEKPDTEPASELLGRIKAEKERLVKEKKIRKEKALPEIAGEEIPFEVPDGWEWCRLRDLTEKTGSGSTPAGGKSVYSEQGIPFLRSQNVHNDGLFLHDVAFISDMIHKRMSGTTVYPEDLLLNITGGSIGRCAVVSEEIDEANVNQHVAIIRPIVRSSNAYLHSVILSQYFQRKIEDAQTGAGREGLPKGKMDRLPIPVPPLAEQAAIVERVESLMAKCDELEGEIEQSQAHAEDLLQAVLREAFAPAAS